MSDKIKIMILQTRHTASISSLTAELVKAFPVERYELTLVYLESGEPAEADSLAHNVVFLGLDKTDYKGLRLKAKKKMRPFLEANHFDVIIANMFKPMHLLMQLRKSISAPVCIGIIHAFGEFDRWGRRWMMRFNLDHRWHLVGVSSPVRDYLINARCGLHQHNTVAINNAVDVNAITVEALDTATARKALALPETGMIFGTLGRSVKGKRHLQLVQAFHQLLASRNDIYLVIIGDGETKPELDAYVTAHHLGDKVFLVGDTPRALRYLRALDVFVFPSESEGFGIALLEAMALSLPTIVNRVEPLVSIVSGCGVQVDSRDIEALSEAMAYYCDISETERRELGQKHYQRVAELYDIEGYRTSYRTLVENLLLSR
jgi:glycosyltransferase involved in cell wall biosynthesis